MQLHDQTPRLTLVISKNQGRGVGHLQLYDKVICGYCQDKVFSFTDLSEKFFMVTM